MKKNSGFLLLLFLIISGTMYAQIQSLPYLQNFDLAQPPNLPLGWTSLVSDPYASIQSNTIQPFSSPNSIRLINGMDTAAHTMLIAPLLDNEIAINTMKLRFYARRLDSISYLSIGVMDDPADGDSYLELENILIPNIWTQFYVSLSSYTGTGRYIAFKIHSYSQTNAYTYLDNILFDYATQYDLRAIGIVDSNPTPSFTVPTNYLVRIKNEGYAAITDYQIKLFRMGGIEIASVNGSTIQSEQILDIPIVWTPDFTGPNVLYALIVFPLDENPNNNQSPNWCLYVIDDVIFPPPPITQPERFPIDMFWKNSLAEFILSPQYSGIVTGIILYSQFQENLFDKPIKIWMGTTNQTNLSAGWIPASELSLVFDGFIDFPYGDANIQIPLDNPFTYINGENLVFMFQRPLDIEYYGSNNYFQCCLSNPNVSRRVYSDTILYDPFDPPDQQTNLSNIIPHITLLMEVADMGGISGSISDENGEALSGVEIQINPGAIVTGFSSEDGTYHFSNIPMGSYVISFTHYDYVPVFEALTLSGGANLGIDVSLARQRGMLCGFVRDDNEDPIWGATVQAGDYVASSNDIGYYVLELPTATYTLSATATDYEAVTLEDIAINADQTTTQDLSLQLIVGNLDSASAALVTKLYGASPNPFNPSTNISFHLSKTSPTVLTIYNVKGQVIRTLINSPYQSGRYSVTWDGRDERGNSVSSGLYFCRLKSADSVLFQKLLLLK